MALSRLDERCLIHLSGEDAQGFLQNLITQDVVALPERTLAYGCLLTPQGRFLHDMFFFRDAGGFCLEVERARRDDFIRRLNVFKLRAKVTIADEPGRVYAGERTDEAHCYQDPRLPGLGWRSYTGKELTAGAAQDWQDHRIHLGVPEGSIDMRPEVDIMADINLDALHAVSFNKGCFVGQEVTARVNWRALIKRRLFIVSAQGLEAGQLLLEQGRAVGEVRSVNAMATEGLAVLKLDAVPEGVDVRRPDWLIMDIKANA